MSNDEWGTPKWLYEHLNWIFKFDLDVCASKANHKHKNYYTKKDNALTKSWAKSNFCNPPYSDQAPWIKKAIAEAECGNASVLLLMCDISTANFRLCYEKASEIWLINNRIRFDGAKGAPRFSSMIAIFKPHTNEPRLCIISLISLKELK